MEFTTRLWAAFQNNPTLGSLKATGVDRLRGPNTLYGMRASFTRTSAVRPRLATASLRHISRAPLGRGDSAMGFSRFTRRY